jgi:hypothetical protein
MTKEVHGWGMYGMWGPVTDPGMAAFTARVKDLGVNVHSSPYRDYDVAQIVAEILALPPEPLKFIFGASLGACNCSVVAAYVPQVRIDGMWGFQPSLDGAQVKIGSNVKFAHCVYNPTWWQTAGLGAYRWEKAPGSTCNLYVSERSDFHPGETLAAQEMFLGEMKRIIAASQTLVPQALA